jgi:hypothetical protein
MARSNLQLQIARSPVLRHGLAPVSFVIALCMAPLEQRCGFRELEVPLFQLAIALTVWYAGPCPGILVGVA